MPVQHVYIDESVHPVYKELIDDDHPFISMKDVFLAAAVLGYQNQSRVPLEHKQDVFQYATFSSQHDIPTLQAVAILATGKPEVVADIDELLSISQEYANGGIGILQSIVDAPGYAVDNFVQYLLVDGKERP